MLKKVFIIDEVILIGIALVKPDLLVFLCLGNRGYSQSKESSQKSPSDN